MFRRKKKTLTESSLPFTRVGYDNAVGLFTQYVGDDGVASASSADPSVVSVLEHFLREGVPSFDELLADSRGATVEPQLAFEVTQVLVKVSLEAAEQDSASLPEWLAPLAADEVSRLVPIARGSEEFTVNRAERVVLEALCATFISLLDLDIYMEDPRAGVEASAQCVGVLLLHWFMWNRPYAFAAFKGEDLLPG